jgi:hypothetical protein
VNNPHKKKQGFSPRAFPQALFNAVKGGLSDPEFDKWIWPFIEKARPCLKALYLSYKIPPGEVIEIMTFCKFAPAPAVFPEVLRSAKRREKVAAQFEKLAETVRQLDGLRAPVWGVKLFPDLTESRKLLDVTLHDAAEKIREVKSVSGRPEDRMLRECAEWLSKLFRDYKLNVTSQRSYIDALLKAAFPDRWLAHADGVSAVKSLLK